MRFVMFSENHFCETARGFLRHPEVADIVAGLITMHFFSLVSVSLRNTL